MGHWVYGTWNGKFDDDDKTSPNIKKRTNTHLKGESEEQKEKTNIQLKENTQ